MLTKNKFMEICKHIEDGMNAADEINEITKNKMRNVIDFFDASCIVFEYLDDLIFLLENSMEDNSGLINWYFTDRLLFEEVGAYNKNNVYVKINNLEDLWAALN